MFYKLKIAFFLLLIGAYTLNAQGAREWELDKDHTSINFNVKHFFSTVNGSFNQQEGTFFFEPDNLEDSKFTFKIPVSSIDTNNEKRDKHLKSADFFNADKYPYIEFESTEIKRKDSENFIAHGNLKIKDVSKRVSVPFTITGKMDHPMKDKTQILGLSFKTMINRTDYSVGTGDWAATMVVGDEVGVEINMELNRITGS